MFEFGQLLEKIKEYDIITIYRHINPDMDAFGSQYGLKYWINDNFPTKQVYCLGEGTSPYFEALDSIDNNIIEKSLAIILDTPTAQRVDDERFNLAKYIIMIDHHPSEKNFADLNVQNVNSAATAELLTEFIRFANLIVNKRTAQALLMGMLTDTLTFKTNNTSSLTLNNASYLLTFDLNIAQIYHNLFDTSLTSYRFKGYLSQKLSVVENFGYVIINEEELKPFNIELKDAKNYVSEFGEIKGINIWGMFILNDDGTYDGSIRSKDVTINDIARQYNGGGHKNACGVKQLTIDDLNNLILNLVNVSK